MEKWWTPIELTKVAIHRLEMVAWDELKALLGIKDFVCGLLACTMLREFHRKLL